MQLYKFFLFTVIVSSPIFGQEITTFFKWCRMGNYEEIKEYVDKNYDVAAQDEDGNTPFHLVAKSGKEAGDIINYMIRYGKTACTENVLGLTNKNNESVADAIYDCIPDYSGQQKRHQV